MWTDDQIKMFVYEAKGLGEIERTMISMRDHIEMESARRAVVVVRLRTLLETMRYTLTLLDSERSK